MVVEAPTNRYVRIRRDRVDDGELANGHDWPGHPDVVFRAGERGFDLQDIVG